MRLDISSCLSWNKDDDYSDNTIQTISRDSWYHSSLWGVYGIDEVFLDAFELLESSWKYKGDYNDDGIVNFNEALLYRAINYNYSITPITFDREWKQIDIVMNWFTYTDSVT